MNPTTTNPSADLERTRREILHDGDLIPPLPDLVVRLLAVLGGADTGPADVEHLLQNDPVLVARMLAMANSPLYGVNRPARGIKDAVVVLGFRGVRSVLLATSTMKFLQRDYRCYGHRQKGLWQHSVSVGACARALAQACRFGDERTEMAFIAGLLHDIGKLVLAPRIATCTPATAETPVDAFERASIGIDHAEAGALVAAKWNLAEELQDIIATHHRSDDSEPARLAAVVRVADAVAHEYGAGYEQGCAPAATLLQPDIDALDIGASWPLLRDGLIERMDEAVRALASVSS